MRCHFGLEHVTGPLPPSLPLFLTLLLSLPLQAHDAFSQLFLTRVPFLRGYDYYIEVPLLKSGPTPGPEVTPEEEAALCDMMVDTYLTRRVTGLTEKALGNRARRVRGVCRSGRMMPVALVGKLSKVPSLGKVNQPVKKCSHWLA